MKECRFFRAFIPNKTKGVLKLAKMLMVYMLIGTASLHAGNSYLQEAKVKLKLSNSSVRDIIKQIEQSSDFVFVLSDNLGADIDKKVSVDLNSSVDEVLSHVLSGTDLAYKVIDKQVIVYKDENATPKTKAVAKVADASQADVKIAGHVVDAFGDAVIGASVRLKGSTTVGTITDLDGNFSLSVPKQGVLVVSYIGYQTKEYTLTGQTQIKITLSEDSQMLDELVVVGYGTQRKKDLTGSISSIKSEDFNQGAVGSNPLQLVEGKVAGLVITRTNGNDPNADLAFQLRGVSSANGSQTPLIIIDGVPDGDLQALNPNDIESLDVLKDGSAAAIYGTRGTNGVILVTTKKGKAGKAQVNFDAMFFTESVAKKLKTLNAEEYWQFSRDKNQPIIDGGYDTDWFDELIRTPFSQTYNVSVSGGNENMTYRGALGYKNQEGITVVPTGRETLNGRLSLSQTSFDGMLKFDMNLAYTNIESEYTSYKVFDQSVVRNPTFPIHNNDGSFHSSGNTSDIDFNPVAYLTNMKKGAEFNKFAGDLRVTLTPITNLNLSVLGAMKKDNELNYYHDASSSEFNSAINLKGVAERSTYLATMRTLETMADYNIKIDKHHLYFMGAYSYQEEEREGFSAKNMNFSSDAFLWNNLGEGSYLTDGKAEMGSEKRNSKLIAFLGRVNYNFDEKYLVSASMRREGSTRFGKDHKWGNFPAVSVGWRASNEEFLKDYKWLSDLKLRAGYGLTGNQMTEDYISLSRMNGQEYIYHNGSWVRSYAPSSNPNEDLKWEVKHEFNIGLDASFLRDRIGVTIDWYKRQNKDLLYQIEAAVPSLVHNKVWANVGSMESNGLEISVFGTPIKNKDVTLDLSGNFSYNESRVKSMSNSKYVSAANYIEFGYLGGTGVLGRTIRFEAGERVGNFYGFKYEGLTPDGKWIFEDVNKDGEYGDADKQIIGNGIPKYFVGFNANLKYKRFDASLALKGALGFDILNTKELYYGNPSVFPVNNLLKSALDKHKNINDTYKFSDYYLENGNYLKLSNITIGYNFDTALFNNKISKLRVFASGENLYTFTKYTGLDPELSSQGMENTGIDQREFYPRTRTFSLGLSVGF